MPNYKKLYFKLFNQISDTVESLQDAQCQVENLIMDSDDTAEQAHTDTPHPNAGEKSSADTAAPGQTPLQPMQAKPDTNKPDLA